MLDALSKNILLHFCQFNKLVDSFNDLMSNQSGEKRNLRDYKDALKSLDEIELDPFVGTIILKLPLDLHELKKETAENLLSFREFSAILNSFNLKLPRNRTKTDMINMLVTFVGDLWPEVHFHCKELVEGYNVAVAQERKNQDRPLLPRNYKINEDVKTNSSFKRTPFDPHFAQIISEMYMAPQASWPEILETLPLKEASKFHKVFHSIQPAQILSKNETAQRDNLLLQYIIGPTSNTLSHTQKMLEQSEKCKQTSTILTKK